MRKTLSDSPLGDTWSPWKCRFTRSCVVFTRSSSTVSPGAKRSVGIVQLPLTASAVADSPATSTTVRSSVRVALSTPSLLTNSGGVASGSPSDVAVIGAVESGVGAIVAEGGSSAAPVHALTDATNPTNASARTRRPVRDRCTDPPHDRSHTAIAAAALSLPSRGRRYNDPGVSVTRSDLRAGPRPRRPRVAGRAVRRAGRSRRPPPPPRPRASDRTRAPPRRRRGSRRPPRRRGRRTR